MELGQLISVTATLQNPALNRLSFGEPAVFGYVPASVIPATSRTRRYSTATALSDMLDDGFAASDPVYKAVAVVCAQSPRPQTIKVLCGRSSFTLDTQLTCTAAATGDTLDITIRAENPAVAGATLEETVSIPGSGSADTNAANLATALQATAIGDPATGTFTFTNTGAPSAVVDIAPVAVNTVCWIDDLYNITTQDKQADRGIAAEIQAIIAADADWYELIPADAYGEIELLLLASAMQTATNKVLSCASQDSEPRLVGTGIGHELSGLNRTKTMLTFSLHGMDEFPNAAVSGGFLAKDPGTYMRAYKSLSGVTPSNLTTDELALLHADFVNTYTPVSVGGVSIVAGDLQRGWCSGSVASFMDTYRLIDATVAEIQLRVFSALRAADKIPFTDPGISVIKGAVLEAVKSFGPQAYVDGSVVCNVPSASSVSAIDRAARTLPGVNAGAQFAGGIGEVNISLTLSF